MSAAVLVRDLTAFSIQVALIVLAVAVLLKVIHVPARARYHGLRLALVVALLVPWLLRSPEVLPEAVPQALSRSPLGPVGTVPVRPSSVEPSAGASEPRLDIPWLPVLLGVLACGVAGRGLWLGMGLIRLRRMTKAGRVVEEPEYAELQEQIGARATIAQVLGLAQPATFGVRRPVVMLPDALAAAPASLRRAVIIHELYHVRRRDWVFVLAEELVRTVLWFHPAILWLTSQIQLAREEIVDELTVRATGDRRGYMQALLSFADSGGLSPLDGARGRPAPAFAQRRQLFHRILGVSKEKVMSRPRIVISSAVLVAVVFAASLSASSLFPIVKASPVTVLAATSLIGVQNASLAAPVSLLAEDRFLRPAPARTPAALLDQQTGAASTPRQVTPENPIPRRTRGGNLAWPPQFAGRQFHVLVQTNVTLDRSGAVTAVERGRCQIAERPAAGELNDTVCSAFFDVSANAIRQWRYERPVQAPLQFTVLSTFVPGAEPSITQAGSDLQRYIRETPDSLRELDGRQTAAQATWEVVRAQLDAATNRLRELERQFNKASELYGAGHPIRDQLEREMARANAELATLLRARLLAPGGFSEEQYALAKRQFEEASNQLREVERQIAISRRQPESNVAANIIPDQDAGASPLRSPSGRAPFRVGGTVTAPRVLKSVHPTYSAEAMAARLQGTVRLQALIDEQGRVADARVLNSIPLLDEQALAAAKQWEFTPALRNGEPVPVLIVMELHFTLR